MSEHLKFLICALYMHYLVQVHVHVHVYHQHTDIYIYYVNCFPESMVHNFRDTYHAQSVATSPGNKCYPGQTPSNVEALAYSTCIDVQWCNGWWWCTATLNVNANAGVLEHDITSNTYSTMSWPLPDTIHIFLTSMAVEEKWCAY